MDRAKIYDSLTVLQASVTKTADFTGTTYIKLDGYTKSALAINVTALDTADGDETYTFNLIGSDDASGTTTVTLGTVTVTATGKHIIQFHNEHKGTVYPYVRLDLDVGGTTPSATYLAWISK